jgi:hypothetical protein
MQLKPFALLIRTIDRTFPFAAAAILAITKGPNWALSDPTPRSCERRSPAQSRRKGFTLRLRFSATFGRSNFENQTFELANCT